MRAAVFATLGLMLVAAPASAQWPPYAVVRIADDVHTDSGLRGAQCVGLNDLGTVSFTFGSAGATRLEIWRGNGKTFTKVDDLGGGACPSINDFDEWAYIVLDPGTSIASLVRNSGGVFSVLRAAHRRSSESGGEV